MASHTIHNSTSKHCKCQLQFHCRHLVSCPVVSCREEVIGTTHARVVRRNRPAFCSVLDGLEASKSFEEREITHAIRKHPSIAASEVIASQRNVKVAGEWAANDLQPVDESLIILDFQSLSLVLIYHHAECSRRQSL